LGARTTLLFAMLKEEFASIMVYAFVKISISGISARQVRFKNKMTNPLRKDIKSRL
jgi:hypothetical protein